MTMEASTGYETLEGKLGEDVISQEEPIEISYKTSAKTLEEICLNRQKQHVKGLRGMTLGFVGTLQGTLEIGIVIYPVYLAIHLFGNQHPDLIKMAIGGGTLVLLSYNIKTGIQHISTGVHYALDGITSIIIPVRSTGNTTYFVKDRYTNTPSWWDTKSGIRVNPFENAIDFLSPNEGAYIFVNGLRIMNSETSGRPSGIVRRNRYTTIVKAYLNDHVLDLNIRHRSKKFIDDIAALHGKSAFYLMGDLSYKPDGYHLDLKDYGLASTKTV